MSIQAYYNSCMCPVSTFEYQGDLADMSITVVSDTDAKTQKVPAQINTINRIYGQDCGGYMLMIEPLLPFLSLEPSTVDSIDVITVQPQTDG